MILSWNKWQFITGSKVSSPLSTSLMVEIDAFSNEQERSFNALNCFWTLINPGYQLAEIEWKSS